MVNRKPVRNPVRGNVLIDLQKDMFMDDIAPLVNGMAQTVQNNASNRLSLNVSGACDEQTNDLEQRIVKVITEWKTTLRPEEK